MLLHQAVAVALVLTVPNLAFAYFPAFQGLGRLHVRLMCGRQPYFAPAEIPPSTITSRQRSLNKEFVGIAAPALLGLVAEPLASFADSMCMGRLGVADQAAMGAAAASHYSIAKLYNDPLVKTSTSLVAGKTGEELEASVASAVAIAAVIGLAQSLVFLFGGDLVLSLMGVTAPEIQRPAASYLRFRGLGIPASTVLLVANGVFRGQGDTRTPLRCVLAGSLLNVLLAPVLILGLGMGAAGAGAATSIAQWAAVVPMLVLLNRSVALRWRGRPWSFFRDAVALYLRAGGHMLVRTIAKVIVYAVMTARTAQLGAVSMAAFAVTFNIAFATSQLCEAIAVATQALLARHYPFRTKTSQAYAAQVIRLSLGAGLASSTVLAGATLALQRTLLSRLTQSPDVMRVAKAAMPLVVATQLLKGLAYSTGGVLLGGLDWTWSSLSFQLPAVFCIALMLLLPPSIDSIWTALVAFMATQVVMGFARVTARQGPWKNVKVLTPGDPENEK